ncbi:DUF393 domain-containing protein [Bacillaceae bacterium Marseille-Q3522]|nr:DUF393 domain-containing protein [Bacillaceae bacterium Marseille-Q3522]
MKDIIVYYDDWCPLCISIKKKIEKLDWFHLVKCCGIREEDIEIPLSQLVQRLHVKIVKKNKVVSGMSALIAISWRLPLTVPFWPILKLVKAIGIGDYIYNYIARKRKIVPVGKCDADCKMNR